MLPKKQVSLVEARASLGRLTQEVAGGGGPVAIIQRSQLAAVLVNAERYKEDMAELEQYRRQRRKGRPQSFRGLIEITGDLEEASRHFTAEYEAAVKRSAEILSDALRD
jgi:PHD/YefM family antitoxin component YafN of YafNO toxin-antitoxin module